MPAVQTERPVMSENDAVNFWSKVAKSEPTECWPWLGTVNLGYGHYKLRGERRRSHVVAIFLATGEWPLGRCVCHKCDNRLCCNPGHLFLGTQAENMADKVAKGRQASGVTHGSRTKPHRTRRGEGVHTAKLNPEKVLEIRRILSEGKLSQKEIADIFGVSQVNISCIELGKTWKHVILTNDHQ